MHIQFRIRVFVILIQFVERACIYLKRNTHWPNPMPPPPRAPIKIGLSILGAPNFHKATTIAFCHIVKSKTQLFLYYNTLRMKIL